MKRVDARRNEQALLDAAAAVFVESGVDAPVREIAARAGVGMGTIYRHFPSRAELIVAVYHHQVEACADTGPSLAAGGGSPIRALAHWVDLFVDFLVTKHGLSGMLHGGGDSYGALHAYFIDRLVPACASLLDAAREAGEIVADVSAYELMRGVGNLCAGAEVGVRGAAAAAEAAVSGVDERAHPGGAGDDGGVQYDARRLVHLLLRGLES